jgi:RES domain-containing protein
MRRIPRGGTYFRICKAEWTDCTDTRFSLQGGRWNAPGTFPVLYLNRTLAMAALQAIENFRGEAHSLFDLRPERRPHLQEFEVPSAEYIDVVSAEGIAACGLPEHYPEGVDWAQCQPIGRAAYDQDAPGIACRTACPGGNEPEHEELAVFVRTGTPAAPGARHPFSAWFPTGAR